MRAPARLAWSRRGLWVRALASATTGSTIHRPPLIVSNGNGHGSSNSIVLPTSATITTTTTTFRRHATSPASGKVVDRAVKTAEGTGADGLEQVIRKFMEQQKSTIEIDKRPNKETQAAVSSMLQQRSVDNVLLACSLYDSYTFEEDGLLAELLFSEHAELHLKKPPNIRRVSTAQEALQRLATGKYDMIISLFRLEGGLNIEAFIHAVDQVAPNIPLLHLALNPQELAHLDPRIDEQLRFNFRPISDLEAAGGVEKQGYWRRPFLWNGDVSLFLAMIKSVEDRLNIARDIAASPHEVKCIIVVEDSVQFYSSYLPMLYKEILKQIHVQSADVTDPKQRLDRIKKRPKVLLATNYEEALQLYNKFTSNVMGVITDAGFPRNNVHDKTAGVKLAAEIRRRTPDVPILLQSSEKDIGKHAERLDVEFVNKNSSSLLYDVRAFLDDNLGFGDFRFRAGPHQPVLTTATDLKSLVDKIQTVSDESVVYHGSRNHFSTWLASRGYYELANSLQGIRVPESIPIGEAAGWVRTALLHRITRFMNANVSEFDSSAVQWSSRISRIGKGSLGGKGRGFRFLNSVLERYDVENLVPGVRIIIPRSLMIAASEFDAFVHDGGLGLEALKKNDDAEIAKLFLAATLPAELTNKLRHHLTIFRNPIAIRSSSLFEDAFQQPFAGVYNTYMLANNDPDPNVRLTDLQNAVKLVYASTFFMGARAYAEATRHRIEEEKMAVIIQEVSGEKFGDFFLPALSGVAVAIDYYPLPNTTQNDGSCSVAPGLGAMVVDGMSNIRFSLGDNKTPTGLANEEELELFAIDLKRKSNWETDWKSQSNRVCLPLEQARELGVYTTVDRQRTMQERPMIETEDVHGVKRMVAMGVAPVRSVLRETSIRQIISGDTLPLNDIVRFLLKMGSVGLACPVEIEFALTLSHDVGQPSEFTILQIRPMATIDPARPTLQFSTLPSCDAAVVRSGRALGHGSFPNLADILYVRPDRFSRDITQDIAFEVEKANRRLREEQRPYILIGPGRWGTHDDRNGVPVDWPQINGARFMVETSIAGSNVAPSQGAHFFQNVISFGIGYLTVDDSAHTSPNRLPADSAEDAEDTTEIVDYDWLDSLPETDVSADLKYIRHVRFEKPLEVVVDCRSQCGVIMKPGMPFATYVGQFDAFLNLESQM